MRVVARVRRWVARHVAGLAGGRPRDAPSPARPRRSTGNDAPARRDAPGADERILGGTAREEAILEMVDAEGGRMKQGAICERTGWSASTISRTLAEMEADSRVVRVRAGRRKIVCLPTMAPGRPSAVDVDAGDDAAGVPGTN